MNADFQATLLVGRLPESFPGDRLSLPIEENAVLPVADLITFADSLAPERPALVLTSHDITMPGCAALFGYADRDRGIAVISTFRLGAGEVLHQRIRNEIAHELGHLLGRRHCDNRDCVMWPVSNAGELDERPATICGRCVSTSRWWRRAAKPLAAALFLGAAVASGDYLLATIAPHSAASPFSCLTHDPAGHATPGAAGPSDVAHIYFNGRLLFCLRDRTGVRTVRDRSLLLAQRVNELWHMNPAPELVVTAVGANSARIDTQGKLVVEVRPGDVVSGDAVSTARLWAQTLTVALNDKSEAGR